MKKINFFSEIDIFRITIYSKYKRIIRGEKNEN